MPASTNDEEMLKKARFVFKGTVLKLKAANVAEVEAEERKNTVIVRVDEVIQAPATLADYTGQEITVKLKPNEKVKEGRRAVFYTNTWIFAENIAVESLHHRDISGSALALGAASRDPARNLASREMKTRLETADVVVMGKVKSVRLPSDEKAKPAGRSARRTAVPEETPRKRPISEHEPHWREAIVEVAEVEKGTHTGKKEIVIRFPDSDDVRWYRAPKFRPGQEGVFILHKTRKQRPAGERAVVATLTDTEADATEAYTALHPEDFQPLQQHQEVQNLIRGLASSVKTRTESEDR